MSKQKLEAKGKVELEQALAYIERILMCIREGQVNIEHKDRSIQLVPKEVVELEIEAFTKDGKQGIEIELEWEEGMKPGSGIEIKISSSVQQQ